MKGQIVKNISNDYTVFANNKYYVCKCRGKIKNENITPLVGDYCIFDSENNYITSICERKNFLTRPMVANIDQAFIVTSLKEPAFSTNLLDKLLVICTLNNIKPIIILTKKDKLTREEKKELKKVLKYYKKYYKVLYNTNLFRIKLLLRNKTTVFTGQTGSGKSTLMNKLDKNLDFETNEISHALGRGKHTTRCVSLVRMYNGKVLDTPGFSDIDLSIYSKEQIKQSFIEFNKYECQYKDCMHINENNCKIKELVKKQEILEDRYINYKKMISNK